MFRLSDSEEIMTIAFFVLIQYQSVTDRRTDIPPLAIPAVCIARYANVLVKIASSYPPQSQKLPSLGVTPIEFRDEPDISRN